MFYVLVSLVISGMVHYTKLDTGAPLAEAFEGVGLTWWRGSSLTLGATVVVVLVAGFVPLAKSASRVARSLASSVSRTAR